MLAIMKILESMVYVIFQLNFWGLEKAQGGGEMLLKVSVKVSAKFR